MEDKLILGDKSFDSRFILGSGKYDPNLIKACVESAGCEMITVALRRYEKYFELYSKKCDDNSEHIWSEKRRRSY